VHRALISFVHDADALAYGVGVQISRKGFLPNIVRALMRDNQTSTAEPLISAAALESVHATVRQIHKTG
jgi:hypothetical protein